MISSPVQEIVQGEEIVSGYKTVKVTDKQVTRWLALDYGCAVVKDRWDFGSDKGVSEHIVLALTSGEPETALFDVPEYFRETALSEVLRVGSKGDCGPDCAKKRRRVDAYYEAHRLK